MWRVAVVTVLAAGVLLLLRLRWPCLWSIGEVVMMTIAVTAAYASWQSASAAKHTKRLADETLDIARREWRRAIQPFLRVPSAFLRQGRRNWDEFEVLNEGRGAAAKPHPVFRTASDGKAVEGTCDVLLPPSATSALRFPTSFSGDEAVAGLLDRLKATAWAEDEAACLGLAYQDADGNCYFTFQHVDRSNRVTLKGPHPVSDYNQARTLFRRYCRQRLSAKG